VLPLLLALNGLVCSAWKDQAYTAQVQGLFLVMWARLLFQWQVTTCYPVCSPVRARIILNSDRHSIVLLRQTCCSGTTV